MAQNFPTVTATAGPRSPRSLRLKSSEQDVATPSAARRTPSPVAVAQPQGPVEEAPSSGAQAGANRDAERAARNAERAARNAQRDAARQTRHAGRRGLLPPDGAPPTPGPGETPATGTDAAPTEPGETGTAAPAPTPATTSATDPYDTTGVTDPFKILNTNLSEGSPYIDVAKSQALATANSRGLLNSSIAAGAGQRAAIEAAGPFASQQGAQESDRAAQERAFVQQTGLQGTELQAQRDIANLNAKTQLGVAGINAETQRSIATSNQEANKAIATLNVTSQQTIADLDASTRTQIANMNVQANQQASAISAAASFSSAYSTAYAGILANPDIDANTRSRLITDLNQKHNSNLGLVEQMYNLNLTWAGDGAPRPLTLADVPESALSYTKAELAGITDPRAHNAAVAENAEYAKLWLSENSPAPAAATTPNSQLPAPAGPAVPPTATTTPPSTPASTAVPAGVTPLTVVSGTGLQTRVTSPLNPKLTIGVAAALTQLGVLERRGTVPAGTAAATKAYYQGLGLVR